MIASQMGENYTSYGVYELIKFMESNAVHLVYEIHDLQTNFSEKKEPPNNFRERTKPFYGAFLDRSEVDLYPCEDISFAFFYKTTWYYSKNCGANTYLGLGGQAVIDMREFCHKNNIKMQFIDEIFDVWINKHLPPIVYNGVRPRPPKKDKIDIPISFGFRNNMGQEKFKEMIKQIDLKLTIFKDEQSLDNFFLIIFSSDVSSTKPTEIIKLQCKTILFSNLLNEIKEDWFSSMTGINIEKSKAFYTASGNLLKEKNALKKTQNGLPEEIKNIINPYKK